MIGNGLCSTLTLPARLNNLPDASNQTRSKPVPGLPSPLSADVAYSLLSTNASKSSFSSYFFSASLQIADPNRVGTSKLRLGTEDICRVKQQAQNMGNRTGSMTDDDDDLEHCTIQRSPMVTFRSGTLQDAVNAGSTLVRGAPGIGGCRVM